MTRTTALAMALITATGTTAGASDFTWIGGNGNWSNDLLWAGPLGQVPDSIGDTATLANVSAEVIMDTNVTIGGLTIGGGIDLFNLGKVLFVNGDASMSGAGTTLTLTDSPALLDMDVDGMLIKNGSIMVMSGSVAQFDHSLTIESQSGIFGLGVIEMNSTSGDLDLVSGVIWAQSTGVNMNSLTIRRTGLSTSNLNWSHPGSSFIVWDNKVMDIQMPFVGALGGSLSVSEGSVFQTNTPFITGSGSQIQLTAGPNANDGSSTISAPNAIDMYGSLYVSGHGTIDTPLVVLRGTGQVSHDSTLLIDSISTVFDSFLATVDSLNLDSMAFDDGSIEFGVDADNLNVINGTSSIFTGVNSTFDLDGRNGMTVNIADGSTLNLGVRYIERNQDNTFNSTINIDGILDVKEVVADLEWTNAGEINLDSGQIKGRTLINTGTITGTGTISAPVYNNGSIIADGGTLSIATIDLDGLAPDETGIIRAQTGDFVHASNANVFQHFSGSMFIGNGSGVQEVFETGTNFEFIEQNGAVGSLDINGGLFRARTVNLKSLLTTHGVSQIRASGATIFDLIIFGEQGTNTISGTLEVSGNTIIEAGAEFIGEGTVLGVSSVKNIDLRNGASLSDVSLKAWGGLSIDDTDNGIGNASVANLELAQTSKLTIDLAGSNGQLTHDKINALDSAVVDGTLILSVDNGFSVSNGQVITILTSQSVSGSFDSVDFAGLGPDHRATVVMHPNRVDVVINCRADINGDGHLNFLDISTFLAAYQMQEETGDFNNDEHFNFLDISAFLESYSLGCL